MSNLLSPFIYGLLSTAGFFIFSAVTVIGVKSLTVFLNRLSVEPEKPVRKRKKHRSPAVIKSVEINPDEIDRIYVKRSG